MKICEFVCLFFLVFFGGGGGGGEGVITNRTFFLRGVISIHFRAF